MPKDFAREKDIGTFFIIMQIDTFIYYKAYEKYKIQSRFLANYRRYNDGIESRIHHRLWHWFPEPRQSVARPATSQAALAELCSIAPDRSL